MPRYFTHLYNAEMLRDETGEEFADLSAARIGARASASEIIAEQIVKGETVDLDHRLEVEIRIIGDRDALRRIVGLH